MNPDPSREDTLSAATGLDATIRMDVRATLPQGLEQPGDMIGRYKLIQPLGEGGFGSVWRAEQSEPIRREVALKVIKAGMDSREIIARFEAERQALALMDHPNIAAVLDAGTTESGRPFFAMELVKGAPITDYCDAQKLGIRQRLELFIPVCQAVQHAHQKAILHRDLKPSNILVAEVDGKPVPKVIDFGIAKALGTSPEAALQASLLQTQAGAVIGTPQYMSPEQAGAAPDLDTRSDIFTLGIILYELLTGDTPLSRDSLRKAALDEVLRLVREADPKRPSSRVLPVTDLAKQASTSRQTEPAKLARTLSGDLDWIALKALEKERDRRYGSAAAFAQDLAHYLKNEPVEAGPPSPVYRLRKLVRRNRLAFAAAAAIVVILVAGIVGTSMGLIRAKHAEAAEARRADSEREARQLVEAQKSKQDELLWTASRSDHATAFSAFDNGRNAEGLAYLIRALEYRPMNNAALAASAASISGSKDHAWRTRLAFGFEGPITCLAFSPDGRYLAVGSKNDTFDGTLRVIEAATGKEISKAEFGHAVIAVSFSPDGRYVAAGSWVIEAATGRKISETEFASSVAAVSFSPDGRFIAAGSWDKTVRIIEVATGMEISKTEFGGSVTSVSFSSDGRFIAAGSVDKTARVIEAATGKEISKNEFGDEVTAVSFSPDGRFIVAGSKETARVSEATTGKEISKTEFGSYVTSVSFSPDGRFIAVGSWDKTARVIEAATGKEIRKTEFGDFVTSVSFSPDGRFIVAGCEDKTARVIEAANGREISRAEFSDKVTVVKFSPDGRYLAAGSDDKSVRLFEASPAGEVFDTELGDSVRFSVDGRFLALWDYDTVRVFEVTTGKEISKDEFGELVTSVSFSPDGRFIAVGSADKTARVIEVTTGKRLSKTEFGGSVTSVSFSPDGHFIAAGSDDKTARVIEAATGKEISKTEFGGKLRSVSFSPDGRFITAGSDDKMVRVIEAATGKETSKTEFGYNNTALSFSPDSRFIAREGVFSAQVLEVATGKEISNTKFGRDVITTSFSPDGRYLAAGSGDRTARVIEAATGKEISKIEFDDDVNAVSFSPDGRFLAAGSDDKTVWVIEAATGKKISKTEFADQVKSVSFSPDGRYLAVGIWGRTTVIDCAWLNADTEVAPAWLAALQLQAEHQFQRDGKLSPLSVRELLALQHEVATFIQAAPTAATGWQHAILKWFQMPPETRTTSPWTTEPIRVAAGRWLMQVTPTETVAHRASQAPWHPLVPVTLALLEPTPEEKEWDAAQGTVRPTFLARLTLKRLREADEKLYGRETLAKYAFWAASVMNSGLNLHAEALEAINFALKLAPKEDQQQYLEMKEEIQSSISKQN